MAKEQLTEYILDNQQKFYRIAYCYVKDKDRALDIVQNMTCKAFEKQHTLKNKNAIKTWVYRILINECLDTVRRERREYPMEQGQLPEQIYVEHAYEKEDTVARCMEQLPENIRIVLQLRYYEELSLKEIAAITDINLSTVKTRLYNGLSKLKTMLKEGGYER